MNIINYRKPVRFMTIKTLLVLLSSLLVTSCMMIDQSRDSIPNTDPSLRIPSFIRLANADINNYHQGNIIRQCKLLPISTLNIQLDDNSYGNFRRAIMQSQPLSSQDIRLEEMINAFPHHYPYPQGNSLFYVTTEIGPTPWSDKTYLLKVGVQATKSPLSSKPLNSIFLIDLSKEMNNPGGLRLVKTMLQSLVGKMANQDTITLIGFSTHPFIILDKTAGSERTKIKDAIQKIATETITDKNINFLSNIAMAYKYASTHLNENESTNIILASSGILNANTQDASEVELLIIEGYVNKNIFFNTLTFNPKNYDINAMLHLADVGHGFHSYIDTGNEAKRIAIEKLNQIPTKFIASDANLKIKFNPDFVSSYRLLGYNKANTSKLSRNKKYLQNIPADFSYTVLYEIALTPKTMTTKKILASEINNAFAPPPDELGSITLNYRDIATQYPYYKQVKTAFVPSQVKSTLSKNSNDFIFTAAVASLALKFDEDPYLANISFKDIQTLAQKSIENTKTGRKADFMVLLNKLNMPVSTPK